MSIHSFFKNKSILVTGHTGFKGSWLSIWLLELGANVVGYSMEPYTSKDNFAVTNLRNKMVDIRGDIRDLNNLQFVFDKYKPQIVFHLAAQPLVKLSYEIPRETYEVNVIGTLNVLECIRKSDWVKAGIMVTSDKCYENREQIWGYRETDRMGGYDPYSSSKGAAEILIASYRNSFFNPDKFNEHGKSIASVRAGNVIGGGDWATDRIIPDCIRALEQGTPIEVRNPRATRPWQHVLEPLNGYLLLSARIFEDGRKYSGAWNFGPDLESVVPVKDVVERVIKYWGYGEWRDSSNFEAVHEAALLSLDCTKARTYLNWKPVLNIELSIRLTVEWYKNYLNMDAYELCRSQIKLYEKQESDREIWRAP